MKHWSNFRFPPNPITPESVSPSEDSPIPELSVHRKTYLSSFVHRLQTVSDVLRLSTFGVSLCVQSQGRHHYPLRLPKTQPRTVLLKWGRRSG